MRNQIDQLPQGQTRLKLENLRISEVMTERRIQKAFPVLYYQMRGRFEGSVGRQKKSGRNDEPNPKTANRNSVELRQ